ncbi:MAG: hypothetical protein F4164_07510 [Gemmatimonadales bacterium]|nr:hypothetical protein [Gemmatimonadales bacterium]MYG49205.1 hypothetical protein [Gemmatimonadales bacterium]MYK01953.1 hypothetical protein [Candidatus Palauibacter ramosifaciens]
MTERDARGRRDAGRIARDERNMHAVLSAMANQVSDDLPAMPAEHAAPVEHVAPLGRRRAWRRWTVGPLAAAAVVAALLLLPNNAIEEGGVPRTSPARSMVSDMDVEAGRPFVVFPTNDPDIAVVWLLNPEESD